MVDLQPLFEWHQLQGPEQNLAELGDKLDLTLVLLELAGWCWADHRFHDVPPGGELVVEPVTGLSTADDLGCSPRPPRKLSSQASTTVETAAQYFFRRSLRISKTSPGH